MTDTDRRPVSFALYQPDIPQNAGNLMRTAACLDAGVHIVEPCGFVLSDAKKRRAGMDYLDRLLLVRHASWRRFVDERPAGRLVLLTTRGEAALPDFAFRPGDTLVLGRESAGVPDDVHAACDVRLRLPMAAGLRSLNVAVAGAMAGFEALRQLRALPGSPTMPPPASDGGTA